MSKSAKSNFILSFCWFFSGIASGIAITKLIGHPGREKLKRDNKSIAPLETRVPFPDHNIENSVYQRVIDSKDAEITRLKEKISQVSNEYIRLQEKFDRSVAETRDTERVAFFHTLETALTQLNILAADLQSGIDVPANITISLIHKLPQKLAEMGIEMTETIGQNTSYNPLYHVSLPTQKGLIKPGETVVVMTPGFRYNEHILTRSEVRKEDTNHGQHDSN